MIKALAKPLMLLSAVLISGSGLLWYSIENTATAKAQTGGGTMGTYELHFIRDGENSYVTLTSHHFNNESVSYSEGSSTGWKISGPSHIWTFNSKTQAWEPAKEK